ncbi:hypothetical protein [Chitinophaga sp. YIM B06452]
MKEILNGAAMVLQASNNLGLHIICCVVISGLWCGWMKWRGPAATDGQE